MTTPYLKGAANTHVAFLHKHSTRNPQECKVATQTSYLLCPPLLQVTPTSADIFLNMVLTTLPKHSLLTLLTYFWPFSLTHFFWPSCKHICWHSIWLILWHLATTSLTTLSGVQHATLNSQYRGWGPARHTELTASRLGSSTPHWTHRIAVGVQHATLNSSDRGCGPACHTELRGSQLPLRSSTPHWTQRIPVNWGGRRRRRGRGGEGGEEGGGEEETDIKSNNPHLTGGEQNRMGVYWLVGNNKFKPNFFASTRATDKKEHRKLLLSKLTRLFESKVISKMGHWTSEPSLKLTYIAPDK